MQCLMVWWTDFPYLTSFTVKILPRETSWRYGMIYQILTQEIIIKNLQRQIQDGEQLLIYLY